MHRTGLVLMLGILAGCILLIVFTTGPSIQPVTSGAVPTTNNKQELPPVADRVMSVKNYIRANISQLTSEKPSEGSEFTVSDVMIRGNTGVATFTDGRSQYMAEFTFSMDDRGNFFFKTFDVHQR